MVRKTTTKENAQAFLEGQEYKQNADKSYDITLKKPVTTADRKVKVKRVEFQDYICGRENPTYKYCRCFVHLSGGTLLEYKRDTKIADPNEGASIFTRVINLLSSSSSYSWKRLGFTDIS